MTPQSLRAWITVVMRDLVIPGAGVILSVYLPVSDRFQPWQIPLLIGMMGLPVVGRGDSKPPQEPPT